jgi:hypothetical protein
MTAVEPKRQSNPFTLTDDERHIGVIRSTQPGAGDSRISVNEWSGRGGSITFGMFMGDGRWIEGDFLPEDAAKVATLILGKPSVNELGPTPAPTDEAGEWKDDPAEDERWNAGHDHAMTRLCSVLGVDPASVSRDVATETLDGDVDAMIVNVLRKRFGQDWQS